MLARAFAAIALLWLAQSPLAAAALVKCTKDTGGVVYQDAPCPPGKELRNLEADPATLSIVPGTPVQDALRTKPSAQRSFKPASTRTTTRVAKGGTRNAAERRFIRPGLSEVEVIMRIGRPDLRTRASGKGGGRRWSYLPAAGDLDTVTTLTFVGGKVSDVERKVAR
jgi:hypothetical protein